MVIRVLPADFASNQDSASAHMTLTGGRCSSTSASLAIVVIAFDRNVVYLQNIF